MKPTEPFPDEIFYMIFDLTDSVERTQYIEALKNMSRQVKRSTEFNNILKAFTADYMQKSRNTGNKTQFTEQPAELCCGEWTATDFGISQTKTDKNFNTTKLTACSHPIMPVEILKNVDTAEERLSLAYYRYGEWAQITVDRSTCADKAKIVAALSPYGIDITTDNAKHLVRYISDCVNYNPAALEPKRSINRLGWSGQQFIPYATDIRYEGDRDFEVIFRNIREAGDYKVWKDLCSRLRKNTALRMMMAASFSSILLTPLNVLPYVLHVWGMTGTAKTVALMVAMSIWGNPKMGGLVKTMNTTKNAIMRTAAFLHSMPYAGDELQTIKDRWQGNYDQLIYQITEGIDRGRAKAQGGVNETMTWKNTFIFTGEEPIVKANSGGGSQNRVIEVAIDGKMVEDGREVCSVITEHYGFAGKQFVGYLQETETAKLTERYNELFAELCKQDTTDKQAMAMSCILLADELAVNLIFTDEQPLQIDDVKKYLKTNSEVDLAGRAYQAVINWVAMNQIRFTDPKADNSANKGEVWGRVDKDTITVNKDVLAAFLNKNDFDYMAVSKKWSEREQLERNSQGKFVHQTKVYGIKASYIRLKFDNDELVPGADKDGFVQIDPEQMELPFA